MEHNSDSKIFQRQKNRGIVAMNKLKNIKTIIVNGDVTIDWNIARLPRMEGMTQAWTAHEFTAVFCQRGGAAMLADLVNAVARNLKQTKNLDFNVRQANLPGGWLSPTDNRFHHTYAMWAPFKRDKSKPDSGNVWRVQEFLGVTPPHDKLKSKGKPERTDGGPTLPDIVIIDDANLGFRDHPPSWPEAILKKDASPWVLVKMAKPVAQGKLWEHLYKNHAGRLIAVTLAGDLRSGQVQVSRQLSWERTAEDLVRELLNNPQVNTLAYYATVIVSFGPAGVVLLSPGAKNTPEGTLFFDPAAMEGEWVANHPGHMVGYNSCLTAAIARELMLNTAQPDIPRGIQAGTKAMRRLHMEGYGKFTGAPGQIRLALPESGIIEALAEEDKCLAVAQIKNPVKSSKNDFWTILEDKNPSSLDVVAAQIVREGLECALKEVPIGQFGELKTVDRQEIESLHSISTLISDYAQRYHDTPLSIAVFGPPGAGKSFSVEQVATSVMPDDIKKLSFNLSQFTGPEDLYDAFHQVRDVSLTGKLPLVFWDEFDTRLRQEPLGWLRYFLAPMQDGKFQEGQIIHPIGRSIFVFAGGTSPNIESFEATITEIKERQAVKLPDFISRLKGFLNILGPNRQEIPDSPPEYTDPYYVIRRAIILRSNVERFAAQLLRYEGGKRIANIDEGVLRAFLQVRKFRHGARSMAAIIAMSRLAGKTCFERSCLPSETQLSLHVDGPEFSALVKRAELDADTVEELAQACHAIFYDSLKIKHYKYGPLTDEKKREHSSFMPYASLPENEKEQNRANVRDIPSKLEKTGYILIRARGNERPAEFTTEEIEKLAKFEHERYLSQKYAAGWKYAARTNKAKKLHSALVDWDRLPEFEKEKDRLLVKAIPEIIARAGYVMVKSK
jgi:hypothetical protein